MSRGYPENFAPPRKPLPTCYQIDLHNVCGSWYTYFINPYERLSLCVIAKTALAVAATLLLTYTPTLETPMTLTTGRKE
jgi:hypothetical protein